LVGAAKAATEAVSYATIIAPVAVTIVEGRPRSVWAGAGCPRRHRRSGAL